MKHTRTVGLLLLALALLLVSAAACTQPKPTLPTPTLVPLNTTPVLPLAVTDTPAAAGTPGEASPTAESAVPGTETTVPAGQPTLLPTPTQGAGAPPVEASPVATSVPGGAPSGGATTGGCPNPYTVQRGDWLYQIARNCGVSPQALIAANPSVNPNLLIPGQVLQIPGGGAAPTPSGGQPAPSGHTYVVQRGDNLYRIALRFGTTVGVLMQLNNLSSPDMIYVGEVLQLP